MSTEVNMDGLLAVQFNVDVTMKIDGVGDAGVWPANVPFSAKADKLEITNPATYTVFKMKTAKGYHAQMVPFFNIDEIEVVT